MLAFLALASVFLSGVIFFFVVVVLVVLVSFLFLLLWWWCAYENGLRRLLEICALFFFKCVLLS